MKRAAILLPLLLTVLGATILWQSLTMMVFFDFDRGAPGPGFLPFWVSLGVVAMGAIITIQAILRDPSPVLVAEWPDKVGMTRVAATIALLGLFILLFEPLGFLLSSTLFMIVASYAVGYRNVKILIPVCIVFGIALHLLFVVWLRVSLPQGVLAFLL